MKYAIIDSGTSFITVPLTDYNNFKQQVINAATGLNCNSFQQPYYCFSKNTPCSTITPMLQPLVIRLAHVTFTIPPAAYAIDNILGNACTLGVSYSSDDYNPFIFGDPFLRSFYTTFNYKDNRVETAVSIHAVPGTIITAVMATKIIIGITFGVFFGALFIILALCYYYKYKKRKALEIGGDGSGRTKLMSREP